MFQAAAPPPPVELQRQLPSQPLRPRTSGTRAPTTAARWIYLVALVGILASRGGVPALLLIGVLGLISRKKRG